MALMWLWCVVLPFDCVRAITCILEIRTYFAICLRDSLSFPPLSTVIRFNVPKLVVRIVNFACVRALMHGTAFYTSIGIQIRA